MINRSRWQEIVLIIFVVLALLVILLAIGDGLFHFFIDATAWFSHLRAPSGFDVQDLYSSLDTREHRYAATDKIAALGAALTGVFTLMLVWVTRAMERASARQAAGDAPLLRIDLTIDKAASATSTTLRKTSVVANDSAYSAALRDQDAQLFSRLSIQAPTPRFVFVSIENVQEKPFSAARDITVTVSIRGHKIDQAILESPFDSERRVKIELLPPQIKDRRRVFNIASLDDIEISVTSVEYRDLRGTRRRRAAYGQLTVKLLPNGTIEATDGYSRPARWEMP